jgi:hypothetical protein
MFASKPQWQLVLVNDRPFIVIIICCPLLAFRFRGRHRLPPSRDFFIYRGLVRIVKLGYSNPRFIFGFGSVAD